jgi:hypothetical protein
MRSVVRCCLFKSIESKGLTERGVTKVLVPPFASYIGRDARTRSMMTLEAGTRYIPRYSCGGSVCGARAFANDAKMGWLWSVELPLLSKASGV